MQCDISGPTQLMINSLYSLISPKGNVVSNYIKHTKILQFSLLLSLVSKFILHVVVKMCIYVA